MHFIKSLLFFTTAVSALTISRRDIAETKASLADVNSRTQQLGTTIKGWDGSVLGAITINTQEQDLEKAIDSAVSKASDETTASSADSLSTLSYVTGTLEPSIKTTLDALIAAEAKFRSAGLVTVAQDALTRLRTKSASLSDSLIRIASAGQKSAGQAAKTRIDNQFAAAQAAYAS